MKKGERRRPVQRKLTVDLGSKLLDEVHKLRAVLQAAVGDDCTVSRGDVVRIALWRLKLDVMSHLAEGQADGNNHIFWEWTDAASCLSIDRTCPDWLQATDDRRPPYHPPEEKGGAK